MGEVITLSVQSVYWGHPSFSSGCDPNFSKKVGELTKVEASILIKTIFAHIASKSFSSIASPTATLVPPYLQCHCHPCRACWTRFQGLLRFSNRCIEYLFFFSQFHQISSCHDSTGSAVHGFYDDWWIVLLSFALVGNHVLLAAWTIRYWSWPTIVMKIKHTPAQNMDLQIGRGRSTAYDQINNEATSTESFSQYLFASSWLDGGALLN